MMALSIQQPWAWLIVNGYKDIENRTWPTTFRGPVLIHAGKRIDFESESFISHLVQYAGRKIIFPAAYETGGIVGQARITDCVAISQSHWFSGPYGFVIADAKPLPFRPLRGQLKFFNVEDVR